MPPLLVKIASFARNPDRALQTPPKLRKSRSSITPRSHGECRSAASSKSCKYWRPISAMSLLASRNVANRHDFARKGLHVRFMLDPVRFAFDLRWQDLPAYIRERAEFCLLDTIGVGIGGAVTPLSGIVRDHVAAEFGGRHPIPFDGRHASASGLALALGTTIDALDGHDGYNPAKGHVGCGLIAGLLAIAAETDARDGREFMTALVAGYELGSRFGPALHALAPDYHTSGAWVAVAVATAGARLLELDPGSAAHAAGIAEYHGPRSPMMRCIDNPTMLKDGSGWGAMAGVSAALMARAGFTGAPASILGQPRGIWDDLGERWLNMEQYFKPYPVCRWAQGPIEGALEQQRAGNLPANDIARIEIFTFHEATRLAVREPKTTEEAQYSTSFPVAVALARGGIETGDVMDDSLRDPEILRLSRATEMSEDARANAKFPEDRLARVTLTDRDGRKFEGGWIRPKWDSTEPPTETELRTKFRDLAVPAAGRSRSAAIESAVAAMPDNGPAPLLDLLAYPINRETVSAKAS